MNGHDVAARKLPDRGRRPSKPSLERVENARTRAYGSGASGRRNTGYTLLI
jgi:hypothetical protein